jgi:SAM-dependent methyltransferase
MHKTHSLFAYTRKHGIAKTLKLVSNKIYTPKTPKVPGYKRYVTLFDGLSGVEIGGPSIVFQRSLPIYRVVASLDCVNFGSNTLWQGKLEPGNNYHYYADKTGYQYICDAVSMEDIESGKYDFCLSCNVLEHIANPFKAVSEWLRIIKTGGLLLIVVPKKEANFDHNRPVTSFEHLKNDYENNICEDDLGHLEEILRLHDLSMDPPAGTPAEFKMRSLNNLQNRALHQHVFDMELLLKIYEYFDLEVLEKTTIKTDYFLLGKKK